MAYTDTTLIGNYLKRTLTADETAYLAVLIPAIQIYLDDLFGTTFDDVSASSRYYDGGVQNLDIDFCTTISAVQSVDYDDDVNDTYTDGEDYVAEPRNETVKNEIRRRDAKFPKGVANIKVTAKFSSYVDKVPEDVKIAATRLAALMIRNISASAEIGDVESEDIEGHKVKYVTSQSAISDAASGDEVLQGILSARRELLVG